MFAVVVYLGIQYVVAQSINKEVNENAAILIDSRQVQNDYRNLTIDYMENITSAINIISKALNQSISN